jgi:hypothetical protein
MRISLRRSWKTSRAVQRDMYGLDYGTPGEFLPFFLKRIGRERPFPQRVLRVLGALAAMPKLLGTARAVCEVGDRLAERFGFADGTRKALFQVYERWNGKGMPNGVEGEAIALGTRLASVAHEAEIGHRLGGTDGAAALVKKRAGSMLDPKLAQCFATHAVELCKPLLVPDTWGAFLAA